MTNKTEWTETEKAHVDFDALLHVEFFDVTASEDETHVGLKLTCHNGESALVPIEPAWAKDFAERIIAATHRIAPYLFADDELM